MPQSELDAKGGQEGVLKLMFVFEFGKSTSRILQHHILAYLGRKTTARMASVKICPLCP